MKVFAISDLHLTFQANKPMEKFGDGWDNYVERIREDWNTRVSDEDVVIVAGDISWAMRMEDTEKDFEYLKSLKGKKIIIRGNHDYWWKSITKIREVLAPDGYALQNDAIIIGDIAFAGTRGWRVPERRWIQNDEDKKIYNREIIRFELALKDATTKVKEILSKQVCNCENRSGCCTCFSRTSCTLVAVLHYPPFNATLDESPFTQLCEKYGVKHCIYGHLHGGKGGRQQLSMTKNGVNYYLTSCDILGHKLVEIMGVKND